MLANMTMILVYLHLATVIPAAALGLVQFILPKGTTLHRHLGRIYTALMMSTAVIALGIPAEFGPRLLNHFGGIHVFCLVVLVSLPMAIRHARRGELVSHVWAMVGVYVGAIGIAGSLTLLPGRLLHQWLIAG